jgi:hypothetical protein
MSDRLLYWVTVLFGLAGLVLVVTNISLISNNRTMQIEVRDHQEIINKGMGMSQINQALVQSLADASIKNNDNDIRDLLAAQGITIKPSPQAAVETPKASPPPATSKKKK